MLVGGGMSITMAIRLGWTATMRTRGKMMVRGTRSSGRRGGMVYGESRETCQDEVESV